MQKWEYLNAYELNSRMVSENGKRVAAEKPLHEYLLEKGDDGWELVSVSEGQAGRSLFFKRPK